MKVSEFRSPYISIEQQPEGYGVIYNEMGDYSVIFRVENPVLQWSGDKSLYEDFHSFYTNLLKLFGNGYILQKQDLFFRKKYHHVCDNTDFLDNEYFKLFEGREYTETETYLILTCEVKKSFFSYDKEAWDTFRSNVSRLLQMFDANGYAITALDESQCNDYLHSYCTINFNKGEVAFDNIKATRKKFWVGDREVRVISLVDVDSVDVPSEIECSRTEEIGDFILPVDLFSFLPSIPEVDTLIYNQILFIPDQQAVQTKLLTKCKRHSSIPDAGNDMAMEDITNMLGDMARAGKMVVYSHFNFTLIGRGNLDKATNMLVGQLNSRCGIYPSKQCYNQFPLFLGCMPGNARNIKDYDRFLVPADAALCFFYKEARQQDEHSSFKTYFCDRQGIPLAIDPFFNIIATQRCRNSNKFVLGPTGTGKSFFVNEYVRQIYRNGIEVVLVDTGHSYLGLCEYLKGKYITYTDDNPITMNPFRINKEEFNEEKRDFLKSLITLLWKGSKGELSQVEDTLISNTVNEYYRDYFDSGRDTSYLSFNSFYEFSVPFMNKQISEANIRCYAEMESYEYVLKKFYKGGDYERTLNDDMDKSLFDEKFIVFEVDAIKDHKILFPIVTLIIMDLFIQKMRIKKGGKSLIIEEAWKAIESPSMAGYLQYLYKTVRKFNGEAIVVTQDVADLTGNKILKNAIVTNADTMILLDQEKNKKNFDEIQKVLGITNSELAKIFSINKVGTLAGRNKYSEVYIRRGAIGEVYATEVSLAQYYTYTTTRIEKDAVRLYHDAYQEYEKGMMEDWMRIRSGGKSDTDPRLYKELLAEWRKHIDLYRIALTAYIEEQKRTGLSIQLFAEKVNSPGYRVPIKTKVYENIDF